MADIRTITRTNGLKYSIRSNRDRFFFPGEWIKFYDKLKDYQKLTFDFLMATGSRINEARHVKVEDIDLINKRIILRVTKVKAKLGQKNPRPRTISISTEFARRLKKELNGKNNEEYIKILSTPGANLCLKRTLQRIGITDYQMFSIHNIRKTHGNWLKALGVDGAEICTRLGHDYNTFLRAYSSPDVFSLEEQDKIRTLLGDLYRRRR